MNFFASSEVIFPKGEKMTFSIFFDALQLFYPWTFFFGLRKKRDKTFKRCRRERGRERGRERMRAVGGEREREGGCEKERERRSLFAVTDRAKIICPPFSPFFSSSSLFLSSHLSLSPSFSLSPSRSSNLLVISRSSSPSPSIFVGEKRKFP